jgi:hypothetical protein
MQIPLSVYRLSTPKNAIWSRATCRLADRRRPQSTCSRRAEASRAAGQARSPEKHTLAIRGRVDTDLDGE